MTSVSSKFKYNEEQVLSKLRRKKDISINPSSKTIQVRQGESAQNDLGNKSWGMIDFLQSQSSYHVQRVKKFAHKVH